jgi:hypothetical protein
VKDRKYNGQKPLLPFFVHCIVCPSHYGFYLFCPLYCLSFTLLLLPLFVHCIVCPSHCVFYLFLSIVLFVLHITASAFLQWTKKGRSRNVKDRQYNGQKRVEAVMWRTDNTMDSIVLSVLHITASIPFFGHCIVCPSHYCFYLFLSIVLSVLHITASTFFCPLLQWTKKGRSLNVKDRQYNGQKKVEAVMWRTDNTMESFTLRLLPFFVHCIVCPSHYGFYLFCPLYCLSFTLRLLPLFVHCIVCPSHYVFYLFLSIVLFVLHITASTKDKKR